MAKQSIASDKLGVCDLLINTIPFPPSSDNISKIKTDWNNIQKRFDLYANAGKHYQQLQAWKNSRKAEYQLEKLRSALLAYQQLQEPKQKQLLGVKKYNDIERLILNRIQIEIDKFDINQVLQLEKIQDVKRSEQLQKITHVRAKREQFNKVIDDAEPAYSTLFKNKNTHALYGFFREQETKFHFTKHIKRAKIAANIINQTGTATELASGMTEGFSAFGNIGAALGQAIVAIPIISSIAKAVPLVFKNIKAWSENKSTTTKIVAGVALGITVVGLATTIITTALAATVAGAAIATVLAAVGYAHSKVFPYIALRSKINSINTKIAERENRITELGQEKLSKLDELEKNVLLKKLEENYLAGKTSKESMVEAKSLILHGKDIQIMNIDPAIKAMRGDQDLKSYLIKLNNNHKTELDKQVAELNVKENAKRSGLGLGALAVIGAILVCIPTPITTGLGIALLTATAVVGVAIQFDIGTKIKNFFSNLFGDKKEKNNVAIKAETKETPKPTYEHNFSERIAHDSHPVIRQSYTDLQHNGFAIEAHSNTKDNPKPPSVNSSQTTPKEISKSEEEASSTEIDTRGLRR